VAPKVEDVKKENPPRKFLDGFFTKIKDFIENAD
jgi:hypothetical protein